MIKRKFKSKKVVAGTQEFRDWKKYSVGDWIVGELVGYHKDNYGKLGLKLKIEEASFKDGTGGNYTGKVLVANSCGAIEQVKDELSLGDMIQIEYTGQSVVKNGPYKGKECHTVNIDIVEEEFDVEEDDGEDL